MKSKQYFGAINWPSVRFIAGGGQHLCDTQETCGERIHLFSFVFRSLASVRCCVQPLLCGLCAFLCIFCFSYFCSIVYIGLPPIIPMYLFIHQKLWCLFALENGIKCVFPWKMIVYIPYCCNQIYRFRSRSVLLSNVVIPFDHGKCI